VTDTPPVFVATGPFHAACYVQAGRVLLMWTRISRDGLTRPEVGDLAHELGIDLKAAKLLWVELHLALSELQPSGRIDTLSPGTLAEWCGWGNGRKKALRLALAIQRHWTGPDGVLLDWWETNGKALQNSAGRTERAKVRMRVRRAKEAARIERLAALPPLPAVSSPESGASDVRTDVRTDVRANRLRTDGEPAASVHLVNENENGLQGETLSAPPEQRERVPAVELRCDALPPVRDTVPGDPQPSASSALGDAWDYVEELGSASVSVLGCTFENGLRPSGFSVFVTGDTTVHADPERPVHDLDRRNSGFAGGGPTSVAAVLASIGVRS
jgi:hypothetical protein